MEKVVDVTIARRRFGTLLDEVFYKGDGFTIQRKGRALARTVPIQDYSYQKGNIISLQQKELLRELNSLPNFKIDEELAKILRNIRKQKRIEAKIYDK